MELQVYQADGSETGRTVALEASVFGVAPNDHVLWLDVRRIEANARQGTHKVKERGENAHSTRKLYRQKGTGMARAGSARSPLRRSGATTFGPRPRDYGLKLTRKTRRLARCSALSYKAREEALRVVENVAFEVPSTRQLVELVEALGVADRKVLMLTAQHEGALYRSSRNLPRLRVLEARNASTRDLLDAQVIVFQEDALATLARSLGVPEAAEASE